MKLIDKKDYTLESMYFTNLNYEDVMNISIDEKVEFISNFTEENLGLYIEVINKLNEDLKNGLIKVNSYKPHTQSIKAFKRRNGYECKGMKLDMFLEHCYNNEDIIVYGNSSIYVIYEYDINEYTFHFENSYSRIIVHGLENSLNKLIEKIVVDNQIEEFKYKYKNERTSKLYREYKKLNNIYKQITEDTFNYLNLFMSYKTLYFIGGHEHLVNEEDYKLMIDYYNFMITATETFLKTESGKKLKEKSQYYTFDMIDKIITENNKEFKKIYNKEVEKISKKWNRTID